MFMLYPGQFFGWHQKYVQKFVFLLLHIIFFGKSAKVPSISVLSIVTLTMHPPHCTVLFRGQ